MMDSLRTRFPGRSLLTGLASLALMAGIVPAAAAAAGQPSAPTAPSGTRCTVGYLQPALHLAQVTVEGAALNTSGSFTAPGQPALTGLPDFCEVTLTQTDPAGNPIHTYVWLPDSWNGRFQGVGGAVYECGPVYSETAAAIQGGYASATTDCGVNPADLLTGSWALNPNGTLNTPLIDDFSYAGIHDMTVAGKAVTQVYYPSPLRYSYFNGCSTGGREGLMEAQRYPADYNGIVSGSPAINWTKFIPSELWPELVMLQSKDFLPACIQTAFTDAVIAACADGSGVIENPAACRFDPFKLVGNVTPCGTITRADAAVMEKIWTGPVVDTLGAANTATFARLFIAPGAQHCAAAAGPAPANPLQDVVNWVEHGQAPATILATGGTDPATSQPTQRPLCTYPYLSEYVSGDPDSLGSYSCVLLTPAQQRQLTALN